jgi:hypothetical protein
MAMSYIYKSMSDGKSGIKVAKINAGAIYQLPLAGGQADSAGQAIDSEWIPVHMSTVPALVGKDLATPDAIGNTADAELVANPDNIKFSERLRTLLIGEDSGNHVNNFLWAYNVDTLPASCRPPGERPGCRRSTPNGFTTSWHLQHPETGRRGCMTVKEASPR